MPDIGPEAESILEDSDALQAAACTGRPDCTCGRPADHPVHVATQWERGRKAIVAKPKYRDQYGNKRYDKAG
jgi:hypothetical protein